MIDNIGELQEFIEWCKKTGVKSVQIGTTAFELSDIALNEKFMEMNLDSETKNPLMRDRESTSLSSKTLVDTEDSSKEDEDLLFWSSKG